MKFYRALISKEYRMKNVLSASAVAALALALMTNTGCEWTGGGGTDSFNTSKGAGININFTGVYDGNLGGGLAVGKTSAGSVRRLNILQTGSRLEITDNQGSKYFGDVGSPGTVVDLETTTVVPAGAELVQSQITWSGKDNVANKQVEFVGVIHAVSVTDIKGNAENTTDTSTDTDIDNRVTTTTVVHNTNDTTTTTITTPLTEEVIVEDDRTGRTISRTVTRIRSDVANDVVTTTRQFLLTEANSQFRLEGTWIETAGVTANVDALSPGGRSSLTSSTTTTTPATTP